ncbi:hypothetical protein [Haliangium sp.]|uniref:hypothetical protein n=1 Tax=Haliangium sp. TaxID=2663208 RepID=UPI003D0E5F5C
MPAHADLAADATPTPRSRLGEVPRPQLDAVLDRGPGAFLRCVELTPHFRARRFAGWQIVRFIDNDPDLTGVDLQPGDVVTAVNGHLIVRPRNLHALWLELRAASHIVVSAERDGEPFELRFDVVDPVGPMGPSDAVGPIDPIGPIDRGATEHGP